MLPLRVGAKVFGLFVLEFQNKTRIAIMLRNHEVHFSNVKALDHQVHAIVFYIEKYRDHLRKRRAFEIRVIENYASLKEALLHQFE